MATEEWNDQRSYLTGERCKKNGVVFEAKMDLPRRMRPDAGGAAFMWKRVPTIKSTKTMPSKPHVCSAADHGLLEARGYFTRALGLTSTK